MRSATRKFQVSIDGRTGFLTVGDGSFQYRRASESEESIERDFSAVPASAGTYSILIEGRSYAVELAGPGLLRVNGRTLPVEIFDPRGLRSRRNTGRTDGPQTVTAPMPGKVVRVLVELNAEVASGQGLMVVEAMKMQNEVKSPKAGRVTALKAVAGATVAPGEVLVIVE